MNLSTTILLLIFQLILPLCFAPIMAKRPEFSSIQSNKNAETEKEIKQWQKELNRDYKNAEKSPLTPEDRKKFKGHDFFPVSLNFRVEAAFHKTENATPFEMKTTTSRLPQYRKYGEATFRINGQEFKLNVYQSLDLQKKADYEDHLFLPFTDLTNGNLTYGGGRYIDLRIPKEGAKILIDFNKAYNPYCAYNKKYSCPVVPHENYLATEILAGVQFKAH
jgi:hypothetical protein